MLLQYLHTAIRHMMRKPGFTVINITGLAVGLAACLLILLYITDELSYDRFHSKSHRIHRLINVALLGENHFEGTYTPSPIAAALLEDMPEVENVTRLWNRPQRSFRAEEKTFIEDRFFYADSSFFEIFDFKLIEGDPKSVLKHAGNIVLTASTAKKYFGTVNAIGKQLSEDNRYHYTVTGIAEDPPSNSHFKFDMIGSILGHPYHNNNNWFAQSAQTYILLHEGSDWKNFEQKLPDFVNKHIGPEVKRILGISLDEFIASGQRYGFLLQPLESIHLHSNIDGEYEANGNIQYIYLFGLIAAFILIIACINFMNLTTARSLSRAKEVGIRKVLGGQRKELILQFLGESVLFAFTSLLIALFAVEVSLPGFNELANKQLSLTKLITWEMLPLLFGIVVFTGILAGSYPAFYLSAFSPIKVIRKQLTAPGKNANLKLRSLLVLFQFTVSIGLLIATLVIFRQMEYIQNKNVGFDTEQLLIIKRANGLGTHMKSFKQEILKNPNISNAAYSIDLPGDDYSTNSHIIKGKPAEQLHIIDLTYVDPDYFETMGMKLSWGRFYKHDFQTDSANVILNEQAVKVLGFTNLETERLMRQQGPEEVSPHFRVIGVVKDFHFQSLHQPVRPMAIYLLPDGGWANRMAVRIKAGKTKEVIEFLENTWNDMQTGHPFEFTFMDQTLASLYNNDRKTRSIYSLFSILALFIAALGLLGLAAYSTESRTNEIGIRKVLGAGESTIVFMLTKEFIRWVLLANIIAWPLAWIMMNHWLNNFAYRINMPWDVYLLATLVTIVISWFTILYQALKASRINPASSLKHE